jgi:hypothetical protein
MGYFILNLDDHPTVESLIQTAEDNIKLFKESGNTYGYLLTDFAASYIKQAGELAKMLDENGDK